MRILVVADTENKAFWDYYEPSRLAGTDLILSCGDLDPAYLEFLVTMVNCPLLYVRGNHDGVFDRKPPLGCIPVEDRVFYFRGLRILGLGGSMRYRPGGDMYTEAEMRRRIARVTPKLVLTGGFDILLTHAPAKGYGDLPDLPHTGFSCFNELLERWKPAYMFFGHVHREYGGFTREIRHPSGAVLVNACGHYRAEISDEELSRRGSTGSPLYDLYLSVSGKN